MAGFLAATGFLAVVAFDTEVLATLVGVLVTGFLAGVFVIVALAVVVGAFFDASSLTPACLAIFDRELFRLPAVCLLITFFLMAVSIALWASASVLVVGLA